MKSCPVTVVRIYLREGEHLLNKLVRFLREDQAVAGLTVLRGVVGFGDSGELHPSSLLDLSLDLPLVVEFFDEPAKAHQATEKLLQRFELEHVIAFGASALRT